MIVKNLFVLIIVLPFFSYSQDTSFVSSGKPFATIYANFHKGIIGAAKDESAFELVRGYLGYEYNFSPVFYAKINLDVGSPDDLSPYEKARRYAYFKNAYLRYVDKGLTIDFGLIDMRQFKQQESVWERRYLMKTLADEYQLGQSADLGMNLNYKFNNWIDVDFTVSNGEGYGSIQMDDFFKYSFGPTITLPKNFTSRVFYEFTKKDITENTLTLFTSYDYNKIWNVAGEAVLRNNDKWKENHNIFGWSVYAKYNFTKKYQLFVRYDRVTSNIIEGDINPWNLAKDGTALVTGIQFQPISKIKMALNYHDWYPLAANMESGGFIYFNIEVKL